MGDPKQEGEAVEPFSSRVTEEVPGFPGFTWHPAIGQADPATEFEYRSGFHQAILALAAADEEGHAFSRGYRHALLAISSALSRGDRLEAKDLEEWLNSVGKRWLHELPMDKQVKPPAIGMERER